MLGPGHFYIYLGQQKWNCELWIKLDLIDYKKNYSYILKNILLKSWFYFF